MPYGLEPWPPPPQVMSSAGDDWLGRLRERIGERRGIRRTAPSGPRSLSVVILNWNGAAVIERCLEHVQAQTHPRLQLIVVDNGSTDSSLPTLRERARRGMLELVES